MITALSSTEFSHRLVAHRGWPQRYPENSYAGIKAALELGLQHIEIDVHLSADLVPVVCHDHHLIRLCGQDNDVRLTTLEQLQAFSFHEPGRLGPQHYPTKLMTLADCATLIAQYPSATLYVEIKRKSLYHFGRSTVLQAIDLALKPIQQQSALISFDIAVLQLAQRQQLGYPLIPVLLNTQQWYDKDIKQLQPPYVFCDDDDLDPAQNLHAIPYPAVVYEIADYEKAMALLARGALRIESFCCGELIAAHAAHVAST
ncbi:glycerophosphodiester phosphodiesterase family protein [Dasania marina]|uniref:glycerophosphodiester phosphodiesterase family protein n=1 Tax=Dasania marina TaxID=471499 RepID=UPI00037CE15A|nr:glycerophosphodiester phosphodiesterase family protein [Dasania marina]